MNKIESLINQKFEGKYNFLKALDLVYNKKNNTCLLSFLYPQNVKTLEEVEKSLIFDYFKTELNLNAKLLIKFHKSFLEDDLIIGAVLAYFKKFQRSIASVVNSNNIKIEKNVFDVLIKITLPEQILNAIDEETVKKNLIDNLSKNFIATFNVNFLSGENINEQKIESIIEQNLTKKIKLIKPVNRYRVFEPAIVIGREITPEPEFIANIRDAKDSVILAGRIENFTKKSYKRKNKNNQEIERFFYKFTLKEDLRYINMVYFSPKANIAKMDKLADGDSILVIADIKKENGYLNGYVKHLSLCEINELVKKSAKEKITTYKVVFPEKYEKLAQADLFTPEPKFETFVENNTFVVFDCETTGLEADKCEIIEIGAVKIQNGKIIEKFQTLVKPKELISTFITDITGITNEMVENAPKIDNVIRDFWLFSKNTILSGYNVSFDMKFIQKAGIENAVKFENEVYDVMELARAKVKSSNYKLSTVVKTLNLTLDNAHRAFFDALATAEVLLNLSATT